ncbi:hypothetical protein [Nocardiopsis sp. CA-288880]|uniref:hypothetical protein n=1 Tax=Nocardiopsis sp. CA-288880 TaxID=3239995 RepID=UPI003D99BF8C
MPAKTRTRWSVHRCRPPAPSCPAAGSRELVEQAATAVLAVLAQLSLGGGRGVVAGLCGMACEAVVLVRATMTADRAARSAS